MNIETRSFLGRGPSFPFTRSSSGGVSYTEDIARINQSLFILFETPKGSRLMMPEFGSKIHEYRFDPLDKILMERIRYSITEDIRRWEPRIALTTVEFMQDNDAIENSILYVSINYRLINTSITSNYVYPYKLESYDTLPISYN